MMSSSNAGSSTLLYDSEMMSSMAVVVAMWAAAHCRMTCNHLAVTR